MLLIHALSTHSGNPHSGSEDPQDVLQKQSKEGHTDSEGKRF